MTDSRCAPPKPDSENQRDRATLRPEPLYLELRHLHFVNLRAATSSDTSFAHAKHTA